jgi:hypothetical protein
VDSELKGWAIVGGVLTTSSSALVTLLFVIWGVVWGAISLAVIATWSRPRLYWGVLGVLGPLGPLVGVAVGLIGRNRAENV